MSEMDMEPKRKRNIGQDTTNKKRQTLELSNIILTIGDSLPFP
jgi:hypothetical protein